ncbi:hypothetical protein Q1695_005613 [Nippostrongylus brasiliensis]|nr:hypothetical protein Q1695_005613 [Nippostrongylus brasiliensis]
MAIEEAEPTTWADLRLDILIFATYQLCHALSTQQVIPVLLNYTPKVGCFDNVCQEIEEKCYRKCDTCTNVCANSTDFETCKSQYKPDFLSSAMEYEYYCIGFYKAFSAITLQYLGVAVGNFFVGNFADKFGRRVTLMGAILLGIPELVLTGVIVSLPAFYVLRFMVGLSIAGSMSVAWTYCSEMISTRNRLKLRTYTSYSMGRVIMVLLAHLAGEWRRALFYHAALCSLTIVVLFFLPESIIWLKRKGDPDKILKGKRRVAEIKGESFHSSEESLPSEKEETQKTQKPKVSLMDVLRHHELRINFFVLSTVFMFSSLTEYLIDLNGEDMAKNLWIGQYMSGLLASLTRFATTLYLIVYVMTYNAIAVTWEPTYVCCTELMPTDVRGSVTAYLGLISRIGSLIASSMIVLKTVHEPILTITVAVGNAITFVVAAYYLKECKNCDLEAIGTGDTVMYVFSAFLLIRGYPPQTSQERWVECHPPFETV